jgi:hypothetical protein
MSVVGLVAWVTVVNSKISKRFFDIKDNRIQPASVGESTPLLGEKRGYLGSGSGAGSGRGSSSDAGTGHDHIDLEVDQQDDNVRFDTGRNGDTNHHQDGGSGSGSGSGRVSRVVAVKTIDGGTPSPDQEMQWSRSLVGTSQTNSNSNSNNNSSHHNNINDTQSIGHEHDNESMSRFASYARPEGTNSRNSYLLQSAENAASFMSSGGRGSQQRLGLAKGEEGYTMNEELYHDVYPLCIALIIVMWCSIFQASFFAYVSSPRGREIEQILYFTRLFADLVGRPLTRLPRPSFLKTKNQLLIACTLRTSIMVLFFVYFLVPSFPQSDAFVIILVAAFSIMNGYFTVLIYEYAAAGRSKAEQTAATRLLNICFQGAAFAAVVMSVTITSLGWLDHVIPTVDDVYSDATR